MSEETQEPIAEAQQPAFQDPNDPFSQFESPDFDFNPLDESVKERSYTKPNVDPSLLEGELDEPTFEAPSFEDMGGPDMGGAPDSEPDAFANPQLNDLSDKDKKYATAQMVDTVLDGYERLTSMANNVVQIPDDKVTQMVASGELNPNLRIPIDAMGNTVSVPEFVQEFNEQTEEAITTSEEFKEKVRPAMNRVFAKRGIGMTDEQYLLYHFGVDLTTKAITVVSLRRQVNGIFDMLKEQSAAMPKARPQAKKETPKAEEPAPTPTPTPEPPTPPKPKAKVMADPIDSVEGVTKEAIQQIQGEDTFSIPEPKPQGAPDFGNPEILSQLEALSEETPKEKPAKKTTTAKKPTGRKRGRPRKNASK